MDQSDAGNTCTCYAFDRTAPELQVGVDGILDEYGDIDTTQGISDFLHAERVHGRAGADPEHINVEGEGILYLLASGHFHRSRESRQFLGLLQPGKSLGTDAFEHAGLGARLPDTGTENIHLSGGGQLLGRCYHLLFSFGTAGAGDDDRTLLPLFQDE